jgi:Zn finger protein HypA/HybF involved in hydrogenase expression
MHELSIATSVLELARRHVPGGCVLKTVHIVAGPMRAIEPQAMQSAWQAVIAAVGLHDLTLDLQVLPWSLRCPACGAGWTSAQLDSTCKCGCAGVYLVGGDELRIDAVDVDEPEKGDCHAYLGRRERVEAQR